MLELPKQWQDELQTICTQYAPQFEVWAYGSRVTGKCHEASDLDLVLVHPTLPDETQCNTLFELREAITESNLPISVDVMDWARLPQEFHQQINCQRVKLFAAAVGGDGIAPKTNHETMQNGRMQSAPTQWGGKR
jgi:predicted nucleotidyltransferase